MRLTKSIIDKLTYTGDASKQERCVLWADAPSGFGVRIYPSGKKAFIFQYRFQGRKQLKTIGQYGAITLQQAEELCKKDVALLLDGKNPLAEKRKGALGETVRQLCDLYLAEHAAKKKTFDEDKRRIDAHILPAWGAHKVKAVTRQDVASLHAKIGKNLYRGKPTIYEANRVLSLASALFNFAIDKEIIVTNPAQGIKHFKEESRDRFITAEELPRLIQAIDAEPNQAARYALWLYLLTGMRKRELLEAKWSDIDFNRREIRLADTKNSKTHYIPLSDAAMAVLEQIERVEGNPFIIVGAKPGSHLVNIDKPWQRVRAAAGVEDVHIHDLRRTVGSWLAQAGNSLHLIGRVLNHSNASTTAIYARFGQDNVREALERHSKQIVNAASETKAEVIELKR